MSSAQLAKWWATIRISWNKQLSYKLNFLLLVIGPSVVFFFVKYSLWTAIFRLEGISTIQGYDLSNMLRYQIWSLIVALVAQGYNSMNLAEDIRMGRISAYLVYPVDFWSCQTAGFISFQGLQLVTASATLLAMFGLGFLQHLHVSDLVSGLAFSLVVSFFWYQVSYLIGLAAFWLEETWVLRVMFITISQFFSGAILPLEAYPKYLLNMLAWTPFPYLTYTPVKIFMGEYTGSLSQAWTTLLGWMLVVGLLNRLVWQRGLRLYTAAGM